MTTAQGSQVQVAFDTALPFDTGSIPLEIISENLTKQGVILETGGLRGSRQHPAERTRTGPYKVSGSLLLPVSRVALDNLLPTILGGSESTDVFDFAESLPEFQMMIDRVSHVFTYTGCKVNQASFRGSKGGLLQLQLDIEAETENVGAAGSFPTLTMPTEKPYAFTDGVVTLAGSAREIFDFNVVIDNALDTERFVNELTRSEIPAQDHIVAVDFNAPFDSANADLYGQSLEGSAATLAFTNAEESGSVLTFSFATIQFPDRSPNSPGKTEIALPLRGVARKVGSTNALVITNAHA